MTNTNIIKKKELKKSWDTRTPARSLQTRPIRRTWLQLPTRIPFALGKERLDGFKQGSRMQPVPFSPASPPEISQHSPEPGAARKAESGTG